MSFLLKVLLHSEHFFKVFKEIAKVLTHRGLLTSYCGVLFQENLLKRVNCEQDQLIYPLYRPPAHSHIIKEKNTDLNITNMV